ncbi:septum formation family protein [Demequina sp. NBRC 110053]|uniref:septum formation family protein n=1 Tax=Demequina sp. NBRC 110053 TaxID=1570342 RepID=UPI000A076877|nr:septum formation family protein [Demequina sp. NBRC 110053]
MRTLITATAASVLALSGCSMLGLGAVNVEELQVSVGECVIEPTVAQEGEGEVGALDTVDCAQPHHGEVYSTHELTDESYPADIDTQADAVCYDSFEAYVGVPYDESRYYYSVTYPSPETWDAGDRQVACFVVGEEGEELTGSVQGASA